MTEMHNGNTSNIGNSSNGNKPKVNLQVLSDLEALDLKNRLPASPTYIRKVDEIRELVEKTRLQIKEISVTIETIKHFDFIRYVCKVQFGGVGIPTFSTTKEGEKELEVVVAAFNTAMKYIRDQHERMEDK
jgi:hypothetical protein